MNFNVINFVKGFFGRGTVYFEYELQNGEQGRVRVPYVGALATMDRDAIKTDIRAKLFTETKCEVKSLNLVGYKRG